MSRLPISSSLRRARRAVLARRRPLAGLCAALAVLATVQGNAAAPPPRTLVVTAAHDLGAGIVLRPDDLRLAEFDPDSVPAGVLPRASSAVGRTTTGPVRAGEPVTDVRLVTTSLLDGYPGLVAVPVRIGDAGAVGLLRVGDRVTLLAADPQGEGTASVVGRDVPVLAIPRAVDDAPGTTTGALVVVGLPDDAVRRVAAASVSSYLSVALTG
jgi:Flp pilus assembly protein CpaB